MKSLRLGEKVSAVLLCLLTLAAAAHAGRQQQIGYVIIIFLENRTPDNLFHDPTLIANGADIASSGLDSKGQKIQLTPIPLANDYDLGHGHNGFLTQYDNGRMDGADKGRVYCVKDKNHCPPPNPHFKYVRAQDVGPYFQMAEQYVFADHMFQTNQGPSFPAHQFIISGTSAPTEDSTEFDATNPRGVPNANEDTGCTAPAKEYVLLIDANGKEDTELYPCFEHPTLTDLLDNAGLSWRYYTPTPNNIWTGPNAIAHIRNGPDWQYVITAPKQLFKDISDSTLAQVSWVIPNSEESDHSGYNTGEGPSWVASIVNAIGSSGYWDDTAIIIAWDDWGGWYDHVAPKVINDGHSWGSGYVYGFRVPMVIVSQFAKQGYISHVTHDFGSILKFIEVNYGLPSLGYADEYADDLSDCFNYGRREFKPIQAPLPEEYFRYDSRPPSGPDND